MAPVDTTKTIEQNGKPVTVQVHYNAFQASWLMVDRIISDLRFKEVAPKFWETRKLWVILVILGFLAHSISLEKYDKIIERFVKLPWIVKLLIFIAVVQLVVQFTGQEVQPFIYFQF
jgi:hypothetical protein